MVSFSFVVSRKKDAIGKYESFIGNIPALVNLLRSYLSKGSAFIVQNQHLVPFLGVSHKLLSSRLNDQYGFELIQAVFESIPT